LASLVLLILAIIGIVQTIQKRLRADELAALQAESARLAQENQTIEDKLNHFYPGLIGGPLCPDAVREYAVLEHGLTDRPGTVIFR